MEKLNNKSNKYITVAYKLYTIEDDKETLVEEATQEKPFQFLTGYGIAMENFEDKVISLEKGEKFDFNLNKSEAFGNHEPSRVLELDKEVFSINGHFDHENVYKGAKVPLQNEDGNYFMGLVLDISNEKVKMDLNHPLAGKDLRFTGEIIENREATQEEINSFIQLMNGKHTGNCSCGCGNHDGGHNHEGGCGCGNHEGGHNHEGGCGCGNHEGGHNHEGGCGCGNHEGGHNHEGGCGCGNHEGGHNHEGGCGCGNHEGGHNHEGGCGCGK